MKKLENPDAELELSDEDLEDVAGGCYGIVVVACFVVVFGGSIVETATRGRW